MVLNSTHTRLTRTSSDLRTLSAILLPPSPILNADELPTSLTSGEIPVLLEETIRVCDSPLSACGKSSGLRDDKHDTTVGNVARDIARGEEALPENWMCGKSDSHDMCIAPESPTRNERHAGISSDRCPATLVPAKLNHAIHPAYGDALGGDIGCSDILDDCSTPVFVKQRKLEKVWDPQVSCPSSMESSNTTIAPKADLHGDQLLTIATFRTHSTLPTFAPPSPSSSADVISQLSSPVGQQRHRRPLERARAVRFPGRTRSPRLQVNEAEPNLVRNAPPSPTEYASLPGWQLTSAPLPVSPYSCTTDVRVSDRADLLMKHVALPAELSWIKHVMIELWIDQEGFRAVRSSMQLMGYSPRTRSLHPYGSAEDVGSSVTAGVAEFMPTKRETFAFHYATLDGPPTLRMVTVADDETRDYISRQATLSVKANGVYTVLGTEAFIASIPNSDAHGLRLRWKFDYLVSDRKVDGSGKTLPGEKTLTPLTFSCSPYLFHPLQGKKAGLMHIMKKNLVPKVGSQKVEPPANTSSHSISGPQVSHHLSTGRDAAHARSRSDASPKSRYHSLTRSPLDTGGRGEMMLGGTNHVPRARRRRASSAGENSLAYLTNAPGHGHGGMFTGALMLGTSLFR